MTSAMKTLSKLFDRLNSISGIAYSGRRLDFTGRICFSVWEVGVVLNLIVFKILFLSLRLSYLTDGQTDQVISKGCFIPKNIDIISSHFLC